MLSIFDEYVNRLLQSADAGDLSVVWDCGNGASGPVTDAVVERLTGKHQVLFSRNTLRKLYQNYSANFSTITCQNTKDSLYRKDIIR